MMRKRYYEKVNGLCKQYANMTPLSKIAAPWATKRKTSINRKDTNRMDISRIMNTTHSRCYHVKPVSMEEIHESITSNSETLDCENCQHDLTMGPPMALMRSTPVERKRATDTYTKHSTLAQFILSEERLKARQTQKQEEVIPKSAVFIIWTLIICWAGLGWIGPYTLQSIVVPYLL